MLLKYVTSTQGKESFTLNRESSNTEMISSAKWVMTQNQSLQTNKVGLKRFIVESRFFKKKCISNESCSQNPWQQPEQAPIYHFKLSNVWLLPIYDKIFHSLDLTDLTEFCKHFSAALATKRHQRTKPAPHQIQI